MRMKVTFRRLDSGNVDIVLYQKESAFRHSFIVLGDKFDATLSERNALMLDRDCGYWLQLESRNGRLLGEICFPDERPSTVYFDVLITPALLNFAYDQNIKRVSLLNGPVMPRHTQMIFSESANKVIHSIRTQPKLFKSFLERVNNMNYGGTVTFYQDWGSSPTNFYWVHEYAEGKQGMNGGLIWHGDYYGVHT